MRAQALQGSLFATEAARVPGLTLLADFVSVEEEAQLVSAIDAQPWERDFKRSIQQYGLGYGDRLGVNVAPTWLRDFPEWMLFLAQRVTPFLPRFPENAVVNSYEPGVGIGPHRDYAAFGPTIASVSLLDGVVIDFARGDDKVPVYIPRRSLWVATGES
jgi:alkylated DNA repair dioxygenase AlkB